MPLKKLRREYEFNIHSIIIEFVDKSKQLH